MKSFYAECHDLLIVMLNVMLGVFTLSVVMLSVIMLNVIMLKVVAPLSLPARSNICRLERTSSSWGLHLGWLQPCSQILD